MSRFRCEQTLAKRQVETWQAWDMQENRTVVLKYLTLNQVKQWQLIEHFEREIQVLQTLSHPAIPTLLATERGENYLCFVMSYIKGKSLNAHIQQQGPMTEALALQICQQALDILAYLHALTPPVIHRDIKPEHFIWDTQQLYLVDFGGILPAHHLQENLVVGTYGYMAPEQFAGQARPASDLYGLGATLLYLLTGHSPSTQQATPLENFRGLTISDELALSKGFHRFLETLLSHDLEQRPRNGQQALELLQTALEPAPATEELSLWYGPQGLDIDYREHLIGQIHYVKAGCFILMGLLILLLGLGESDSHLAWQKIISQCLLPLAGAFLVFSLMCAKVFKRLGQWMRCYWKHQLHLREQGFIYSRSLFILNRFVLSRQHEVAYHHLLEISRVLAFEGITLFNQVYIEHKKGKLRLAIQLSPGAQHQLKDAVLGFVCQKLPPAQAKLLEDTAV